MSYIEKISIFTDGACSQNGTWNGGWAFVVEDRGTIIHQDYGHVPKTTNNKMEMMGIIKALEWVEKYIGRETSVDLYTDSAYVHNGFDKGWLVNWRTNGWMTAAKKPVKNKEEWIEIDRLKSANVQFFKVKGHSGHEGNELADDLAVLGRDNK